MAYGQDGWGNGVQFTAEERVQTDSGAHPASHRTGTVGFFPRGKAAGA
jgi:hypothetical protein